MNKNPHIEGTPKTRDLCERIANQNNGTCFLHFSRGKDAVATWLFVRQFFNRVIPIYFSPIPHLSFADRALKYYEDYFETPIYRFFEGEAILDLQKLAYAPPYQESVIDSLKLVAYDRWIATDVLRKELNLEGVYACDGTAGYDGISKKLRLARQQGVDKSKLLFEPLYDWTKEDLYKTLEASGLKLSPEYKIYNRTFSGGPFYDSIALMEQYFPDDYEKIKVFYPFVDAVKAKYEFRAEQFLEHK